MGVEDAEGVVDVVEESPALVKDHHGEPGDAAGENAHHYGGPSLDKASSRGDADEAGNHALNSADDGGLLEEDDIKPGPDEETSSGADVGVENGHGGVGVSGIGVSSIEARPPQPQQPRPRQHQQYIVGWKPLPVLGRPRSHLSTFSTLFIFQLPHVPLRSIWNLDTFMNLILDNMSPESTLVFHPLIFYPGRPYSMFTWKNDIVLDGSSLHNIVFFTAPSNVN